MNSNIKISYPGSEKVYMQGTIYPDVRVGMRLVRQMPTVVMKGEERIETPNPSIYIYDTSGPYSDENVSIDLEKGLPRLREAWIRARAEKDADNIGQMYYAKKGIITPEMEYVAIRENMNCKELGIES
ncbi:MAG: phosphomethylpyrimidine synthase, partial [Bacteroidales bacterium]|nr:phosphomethylpyrimidine synthase [Bacteroidales bacterium]